VLVIGGSMGGLCAPIGLRRQGVVVDLIGVKSDWTVYGVGISQQSNVVREMARRGYWTAPWIRPMPSRMSGSGICRAAPLPASLAGEPAGPQYPANVGISRLALHSEKSVLASAREMARDQGFDRIGLTNRCSS
jgi:hypothetical protein